MNTTENQNETKPADKWAAEKAAHAQGKRIEVRGSPTSPWTTTPIPDWLPSREYRIAPDPAPAGKLTDEQLGEIGAKAAKPAQMDTDQSTVTNMHEANTSDKPARAAFARAVREAVEKGQAEEIARLTAVMEQAIEMVNTPGTTKDNLPKAINVKIMQRDEFHDATLKKLDAAKEEAKRLLRLDATNRENCDRTHKALVESQLLQLDTQKMLSKANAELERLRWRLVSVKPKRDDADKFGCVVGFFMDGKTGLQAISHPFSTECTHWRPFFPPPAPSAEDVERERFEQAYREEVASDLPKGTVIDNSALIRGEDGEYVHYAVQGAFRMWKRARAAKEGEK